MKDDEKDRPAEVNWDGWTYPYIAGPNRDSYPGVTFHSEADAEIDPITYEVLRFALWNVNVEHGNTLLKISGSPIAAFQRLDGGVHGLVHCPVLVVFGDPFDKAFGFVGEVDEVANQIEEDLRLENAADQHLELWHTGWSQVLAANRLPRCVVLKPTVKGAHTGLSAC